MTRKLIASIVCLCVILTSVVPPVFAAQNPINTLPVPGEVVLTTDAFQAPALAGLSVYPNNPLKFDFLIDAGDSNPTRAELSEQASTLIKYFLVALTMPEDKLWVNLSPFEENRIVADGLGDTEMGRDLLAQDYMLKQLTASLLSPEEQTGAQYWNRLRSKIDSDLVDNIPLETINKIWIVPEQADVFVKDNKAIVTGARLKVMLEQDYMALEQHPAQTGATSELSDVTLDLIREIVIPVIEEEVNNGETFANLRQIYSAIILSAWFKQNLRNSILDQVYTNRSKTAGIELDDKDANEKIYQKYLKALEKGVYNKVHEDYDPRTKEIIPRHYFTGGVDVRDVEEILNVSESERQNPITDLAMLQDINRRTDAFYVIESGLEDSTGQISYQQTEVTRRNVLQPQIDRAILSAVPEIIRQDQIGLATHTAFQRLSAARLSEARSKPLVDELVEFSLSNEYFVNMVGSHSTPEIIEAELRRAITDWAIEVNQSREVAQKKAQQIKPQVRSMDGLMVAVSLMDTGAVINESGEIDYKNSIQKLKSLLPSLARDGVRQVYMYGGMYEMAETSKLLHQVPNGGTHYLKSLDGRVMTRIDGYNTKRATVKGAGKSETLFDQYGNNFSIYSLNRLNPKLAGDIDDASRYSSKAEQVRAELTDLISNANKLGVEVVADFIPWMAPDGVNDETLEWTAYRRISEEWTDGEREDYLALDEAAREVFNRRLLDHYSGYFLFSDPDGYPILVRHFYNGQNIDQAYLNAFLPEVQDYYIDGIKQLVDMGVHGVRVDLAHFLFRSQLENEFTPNAGSIEEPWTRIMAEVGDYARQQGIDFSFIMETYSDGDKAWLQKLGDEAGVRVQVYHKDLEDAYHSVVVDNKSAQNIAEALNTAMYHFYDNKSPRRMAPATFDDQSLANVGGPTQGFMELLLILAEFGLPTKFDLREWIQHQGHVITVVGGITPDGVITHPYVSEQEFKDRMTNGGLSSIVDDLPWNDFVRTVQTQRSADDKLIRQQHIGYPWYMFNYADESQRDDFVTIGWGDTNGLNLFVLNTRMTSGEADVLLPASIAKVWGQDSVKIKFENDQQSRFVKLSQDTKNSQIRIENPIESAEAADNAMLSERLQSLVANQMDFDELVAQIDDGVVQNFSGDEVAVLKKLHEVTFTPEDRIQFVDHGVSYDIHKKLGSHVIEHNGQQYGTYFAVWAPNARAAYVAGDFNDWQNNDGLFLNGEAGIWYGFIPAALKGNRYKFRIIGEDGTVHEKADPYARYSDYATGEDLLRTASIIWNSEHEWDDAEWMASRRYRQRVNKPINIYEVHAGSWRKKDQDGEWVWLNYREMAEQLVPYLKENNFTHVELMPPFEHSYFPSWGYQVGNFYAPSSRYGTPDDFKALVEELHNNEIAVLIDWVPAHFPKDAHGLSSFDGTELYSHEDPRQGEHPDWGTRIFNYGRHEVRSFLLSNAMYWIEEFHVDGLRVDAVSSMLYLDYGREEGQSVKNIHGGNENLDAIAFLRDFNETINRNHPGVITIAEESTAWQGVTAATNEGTGLGFTYKWSMGWMNDILTYMEKEPVYRKHHHELLYMYPHYAFDEAFILPLSHDEVVHLKGSLLEKMPGNEEQKFANLRLLLGYMATMPGKKLLFMGSEIAQPGEWNENVSLDWDVLQNPSHRGIQRAVEELNRLVANEATLHELDSVPQGFEWIGFEDADQNVISYIRKGLDLNEQMVVVFNFSDVARPGYQIGVPWQGTWEEVFNSNAERFGGTDSNEPQARIARAGNAHDREAELTLDLPPLSFRIFKGKSPTKLASIQIPSDTLVKKSELVHIAHAAHRNMRGGYIDSPNMEVNDGDEITIRVVANRPDFEGTRNAYLFSNRNVKGQWRADSQPGKFIENRDGRAVYEFKVRAYRKFEYTAFFEDENGSVEWVDLSDGNARVDVKKQYEGNAVFVGMEFAPLIKVGGLADVIYSLPKTFAKAGNETTVILPYFKNRNYRLDEFGFEDVEGFEVEIPFNQRSNVRLKAKRATIEGMQVYILDADAEDLFSDIYGDGQDQKLFYESILLSRGSLELLKALGQTVNVINSADSHTALIPLLLETQYKDDFNATASVFTIHNFNNQGNYPTEWFEELGLEGSADNWRRVTKYDRINFMGIPGEVINEFKEGHYANTVSVGYAEEIRQTFSDIALLYRNAGERFDGILNGLDFDTWNPDTDPKIARNYSLADDRQVRAEARLENKRELQQILSADGDKQEIGLQDPANIYGELEPGSDRLLIGVVSRLDHQKQIDIVADMLQQMYEGKIPRKDIDVILNGTGDSAIEEQLKQVALDARKYDLNISVVFVNEYLQTLTQKLMSAADVLLIPSNFEPSGLTQMQAMRYGAIPIVRKTGGLADTVFEDEDRFIGFVFDGVDRAYDNPAEDINRKATNTSELYKAISRAERVYTSNPSKWEDIIEAGMLEENDWNRSFSDYMNVYGWLLDERYRDIRSGTIISGEQVVPEKKKVTLRVETHGRDKNRKVYLRSNRNLLGEWVTDSKPARYVETVDGRDIYEVTVTPRRSFEYTFDFVYGEETIRLEHPEGNPKVLVESELDGAVAFVGMEFGPIVKVGGQGDVMFELPKALVKSDKDVVVVTPMFKELAANIEKYDVQPIEGWSYTIPFNQREDVTLKAYRVNIDGINVILLDADASDLFEAPYKDTGDGQRLNEFYESILLSRGSLEVLTELQNRGEIEIGVVNSADHHTALIPLYMRDQYQNQFLTTGNVFTIHNIGYQGRYSADLFEELGVDAQYQDLVQEEDELIFMAVPPAVIQEFGEAGNYINTVSVSYARETRSTQFGFDEAVFQQIGNRYGGILNGLDFDAWNPQTDAMIRENYTIQDGIDRVRSARGNNKRELQEILAEGGDLSKISLDDPGKVTGQLNVGSERMLVGVVSRLVGQKQIDIIGDVIEGMVEGRFERMPIDFVINGTGGADIEQRLAALAQRVTESGLDISFVFVNAYLQPVTQKIMAGVDAVLVPSDYEPSGLTQMQAMRYGAVPIVRSTGGLADTVNELGENWSGFAFEGVPRFLQDPDVDRERRDTNAFQLYEAIARAHTVYSNDNDQWNQIITTAMRAENDWSRSLGDYINVYNWLREELTIAADPGFMQMSRILSNKYQDYITTNKKTDRPFVIAVRGNYASGKSMVRNALIDQLGQLGLSVDFEHDEFYFDSKEGVRSISDAIESYRGVKVLIYEIEKDIPEGEEEIDMYIRMNSSLPTVQRRMADNNQSWEDLKERVLDSMGNTDFANRKPDIQIQLDVDLTDEQFRQYIHNGLIEMNFSRARTSKVSKVNVRRINPEKERVSANKLLTQINQDLPSRSSGVLMHISSLGGEYGIGDFGPSAKRFVDFLEASAQDTWQVLPLNPTDGEFGFSPYSSDSAFALNPLFVSPEWLAERDLLDEDSLEQWRVENNNRVNYEQVSSNKQEILDAAYSRISDELRVEFEGFIAEQASWLDEYVLFKAIGLSQEGKHWNEWPEGLRDAHTNVINEFREQNAEVIDRLAFQQFILFEQWKELKSYAKSKGVKILGDLPLYVTYDSADVWANAHLFNLDGDKKPLTVSGVPPDAFSSEGQKWGHPTFDWEAMRGNNYNWWMNRISHNLDLYDQIRLDHFRGFVQYWEIDADAESAQGGRWRDAADDDFFAALVDRFGVNSFIAEDLGDIKPDVEAVLKKYRFTRMKILQFGFDGQEIRKNPYYPKGYDKNTIVYTGTHDNNTVRGWFREQADEGIITNIQRLLKKQVAEENIHWDFVQMALNSASDQVILPVQDIFGFDENSRMNIPGQAEGNWAWRITRDQMDPDVVRALQDVKIKSRPKDIRLLNRVSNRLLGKAVDFLIENRTDAMSQELQLMSRQGRIRQGSFKAFASTVYKDANNVEYILISDVDSQGNQISEEEQVANLVFAIGAVNSFGMEYSANDRRANAYLEQFNSDQAMLGQDQVGGIDLNPSLIRLNIQGDSIKYNLPNGNADQPLDIKIDGFVPVIINISPLQNIMMYLGENTVEERFRSSKLGSKSLTTIY